MTTRSAEANIGYTEDFTTAHKRLVEMGMHPLRAARTLYHLSRAALAQEAGVCEKTIASVELGYHSPQPNTRQVLATYFNIEAHQLGLM